VKNINRIINNNIAIRRSKDLCTAAGTKDLTRKWKELKHFNYFFNNNKKLMNE
jgi:hypothetical protein